MSQKELGVAVGRAQQAVADWERGINNPPPHLWSKITEVLGIARSLFTGDEPESLTSREIERASEERRRELFRHLFSELRGFVDEKHIGISPDDFAYLVYTLWTRAVLLDDPPTLEERVEFLVGRQRQKWERHHKGG